MLQLLFRCCAGLDVHRTSVVATVICSQPNGKTRKKVREFSAFPNGLRRMAEWLRDNKVEQAVMESTSVYWKAVYEALENMGVPAIVVNARHVKKVPGRKTDVIDSDWLAELGRFGLLRSSFIPPKDIREIRLLTRYRRKLCGTLSSEKNRLHKILDDCGIRLGTVVTDINGVSARRMIRRLIAGDASAEQIAELAQGRMRKKRKEIALCLQTSLSDRHRWLLKRIQEHISKLEESIEAIDCQVFAAMKPYENQWQLLQTIPGVNQVSAAILLSEIGTDMSCFANAHRLASWAGMCPGNNESGGKRKTGRTRKGNKYVRCALCEIANAARRSESQFRAVYKSLVIRRGHKRAIVAIGHRILKIVYIVLARREPYKDPVVDYEAIIVKRNAPRWINALRKYGYIDDTNLPMVS